MKGKLLIVEDQTVFRNGLKKMIEYHSLAWTVVGEAGNGQEAVEKIAELEPHLILTDIRMPVMDGIQLAEHIYRKKLDILVVILTGYKDFQYAQAALRYGVMDFLLKPCNEQAVLEVLQKAYDKFRDVILLKEQQIKEKRSLEENTLRSLFLRLPHDRSAKEHLQIEYLNKKLWILKVDNYFPQTKNYQKSDLGLLQFALCNIVNELANTKLQDGILLPIEYDHYALFLHPSENGKEMTQTMTDRVYELLGISLVPTPCGIVERWDQLPVFSGASGTLTAFPAINPTKIKDTETQIMSRIVLGQWDELKNDMQQWIHHAQSLPYQDAKVEILTLAIALNETANHQFEPEGDDPDIGRQIEKFHEFRSMEDLLYWADEQADHFLHRFHEWQAKKNENLIKKAIAYIEERYMGSCTLTEVAERLHINVTYFSKLFKKETGSNFTNYVTTARMEKAKLLLCNTEMKVFEIAAAVGYDDPNYFTNVFKVVHNLSPSEFRKKHK